MKTKKKKDIKKLPHLGKNDKVKVNMNFEDVIKLAATTSLKKKP